MMRRGDIFLADLEPVRGPEANKQRPVVVVSNDGSNEVVDRMGAGMVTVVPLTGNVARVLSFQVALPREQTGLDQDSKAQPEQIRAISATRLIRKIGWVPLSYMEQINQGLRLHLDL
jgi:mRNA interferase MazF